MSLVSQQQPWHPAWSRQWIPQSTMQKNDACPQKPPKTTGYDKHVPPLTSNMKTAGMWFTFPQLAGGLITSSLDISIAGWEGERFPIRSIVKWTTRMAQRMEATATGTTTHNGGITSLKWGGRQTYWMLSRHRGEIQSIAHSQPTNCGKEWVVYASKKSGC